MDAPGWLGEVRALERRGELILAYDTAMRGLEAHPDDLWLKHRAVLLLAKAGATLRARVELERWGLSDHKETEVAALEARIAKDEALAMPPGMRGALYDRAAGLYQRVYLRGGGYYPGINLATLRLLAGNSVEGARVAGEVLELCKTAQDDPYYVAASRAEAHLVRGEIDAAKAALTEAATLTGDLAARATTRRQLKLICAACSIDPAVLAPLDPPVVMHYTGHMIAPPGGRGRFLAETEARVAAAIDAMLDKHTVGFGYGSLASGADILFAEALLGRGAEVHVVLPFDREEFKAVSVAPAKAGWIERFEACLGQAHSVTYATDDRYLGHDQVFTYCSHVAMGLAVLRARFIEARAVQLAVWDGKPASGIAGTAIDVAMWREQGGTCDVIDCSPATNGDDRAIPAAPAPASRSRELRAMLFGDVKGFSKLTEAEVPAFVEHVLGAFGKVLERHGSAVLYANTWGDGIFVVLSEALDAARCAIELQAAMTGLDLPAVGLPPTLALRLGGHFGPVFEAQDPVQRYKNFFGAHVSRTARIEPVTPPGEVYVTEPFAARLALGNADFACDYVGQVPAAKGYGTMRMYNLRRSAG
jgi:class 3 adenylate cyclase